MTVYRQKDRGKIEGMPAIPEEATGYHTPYLQLMIRLSLPLAVVVYGAAQSWNILVFSLPVALLLCVIYFFWHLVIHFRIRMNGLQRHYLIAAYAADVLGGHLAWLGDPYDPAPLFLNILFGAFGNGLQHGLYTYRYLCVFNLIATIIVYSIRCSIIGFSFYSFVMVFLGYCLLGYAYRMIQKNDHYKNQIRLKNSLLLEEVEERRRIEAVLRENEEELKGYRDHLERMVESRTAELKKANSRLEREIENRVLIETQSRESQKNEKLYQEQLFQASKMTSLGTLVAGVAHEINNPVSAIMLNAPVLKRISESAATLLDARYGKEDGFRVGMMSYSDIREKVPKLIDGISEGAERIKSIVDDLKDYSRETSLEMTDRVNINHVCEKAISLVYNLIRKSTHSFFFEPEKDLPEFSGNNVKIEQVLINLLINACQALTDMNQSIRLSTACDFESDSLLVFVEDKGCGMTPEIISRVIDPFYTTKRDRGGTGLGLSISDRIVREHNGRIEFVSEPGRGTKVTAAFLLAEDKPGHGYDER